MNPNNDCFVPSIGWKTKAQIGEKLEKEENIDMVQGKEEQGDVSEGDNAGFV